MFVVPNRYRHKLQMVDSIFICIIIKTGRRKKKLYYLFTLSQVCRSLQEEEKLFKNLIWSGLTTNQLPVLKSA